MASDERLDQYRALADAFDDHIFIVDRELRLDYVNRSAAVQFGVTPDRMIGTRLEDWFPPDVVAHQRLGVLRVFETGQSLYTEDAFLLGTRRVWLSTRLVPFRPDGQTVAAVLGLSRDISDQRRLEGQLHESQKMEAIGRLAGGVAHDFNNLLTAILGYLDLLRDQLTPDTSMWRDAQEARAAALRAAELTRQLLAFARRQALRPETLELNSRIMAIEKMLRRLIGEDIAILLRLAPDLWLSEVDPSQLDQVILTLAVNARDVMPDGGRLTIGTANVDVPERDARPTPEMPPGQYVELLIADTGPGMDADTRERLFEPFFTARDKDRGTGLGLAPVYGIVKQSGGHIRVDSEPGGGTTFRIWLPRVETAARPAKGGVSEAGLAHVGATILLVEDEDAVRALAYQALARLGYRVIVALDGADALRLAGGHDGIIDLLLTDVVMPRMSGPDLAAQITRARPATKVLYMSGYTDAVLPRPGEPGPGAPLLPKPFSAEQLAEAVRKRLTDGDDRAR